MDVKDRVVSVIKNHIWLDGYTALSDETTIEDLDLDSLDEIELLICIEEEFDIAITGDEAAEINSIEDAVMLVSSKL